MSATKCLTKKKTENIQETPLPVLRIFFNLKEGCVKKLEIWRGEICCFLETDHFVYGKPENFMPN